MSRLALIFMTWLISAHVIALELPEELEGWQDWVLHNAPQHNCPFISGSDAQSCVWPGKLSLKVNNSGASFSLQADLYATSWLALPGDTFYWPQNIQANNKEAPLSADKGRPGLLLEAGRYNITGEFNWQQMPNRLSLPINYAIVSLGLNGAEVANPVRDQKGRLLLQRSTNTSKATERDNVNLQVYRLLKDSNPFVVKTLVNLDVTGAERELLLGKILPSGFRPLNFDSPLPARIESDGKLRIQVKPGRYTVRLEAYDNKALETLNHRSDAKQWPKQEIWFFEADRSFRTVQIEGAATMDTSQLELEENWHSLPAYLIGPDTEFRMREIYRGDPNPPSNQLAVNKEIWLTSTGEEFTVRDKISGQMHRDWRLEANAAYTLGSVELDGEPQLVTQLNEDSLPGVEIRNQHINLHATSKLAKSSTMPISGWNTEFNSVHSTVHLPPAWSVLSVSGADSVSGSWMSRWNLWDIFLVLIAAVSIGRVVHPLAGLLTFGMLLFSYHRGGSPGVILIFITAALALMPYVKKRIAKLLSVCLLLFFVIALSGFLPFVLEQVRTAVYPQLEYNKSISKSGSSYGQGGGILDMMTTNNDEVEEMVLQAPQMESRANVEEVIVTARKNKISRKFVSEYDASQVLQAGPGIPDWSWNRVSMSWNGPIIADETTRIIFVPPLLNRIANLLSVFLVTAVLFVLLRHAYKLKPWQHFSPLEEKALATPASAALCFCFALFIGGFTASPIAKAEVLVDQALLQTLEERLLKKPECVPDCAVIESVRVNAQADKLVIQIRAHANTKLAFPLPAQAQQWWPSSVAVNGEESTSLAANKGKLYVKLAQGSHSITLVGGLAAKENINLDFQLPLHNVVPDLDGWELSGLPTKTRSSQNISLSRAFKIQKNQAENRLVPDAISPFVKVERSIFLNRRWTINTRVTRIAPGRGAINLKVPLLEGEAPISGDTHIDAKSKQAFMDVRIGPNQNSFSWQSVMEVRDAFSLVAPQTKYWTEQWRVSTSPLWHSDYQGIATVQTDGSNVSPTWLPWPGEQVDFTVYTPLSVSGEKLAIDAVNLRHLPASRLSDTHLHLSMRATQGGEYDFKLPEGAELKSLKIDNVETPISHSDSTLKIPLSPGEQKIALHWQNRSGLELNTQSPAIDLGRSASNIHIKMELPRDRWILAVGGPQIGPAVLFWSLLLVIVAIAIGLSRSKLAPLKSYEWVLLSLGVVSLSLFALLIIAAWFIAIKQRGQFAQKIKASYFNPVQVLLFIFSAIALLCLVVSIPNSLLSMPDMYIQGNGAYGSNLKWFQDEINGSMPQAWVISVPVYVYRIAMLLWSLWLAFALMRWIRWAWTQLGVEGYWLEKEKAPVKGKDKKVENPGSTIKGKEKDDD